MKLGKHFFVICSMVTIISATSCVDERYDLDNVSEEVHLFENGINFPLLQTGNLYFGDLMSSDNQIVVNENGVYEFGTDEGSISVKTQVVDRIRVPQQNLKFGTIKSCEIYIPNGSISRTLDAEYTEFDTNLDASTAPIDSKVVGLESMYTYDDWVSEIRFSVLDGSGKPISSESGVTVDEIAFENYRLELPDALIIDKNRTTASGNISVTKEDGSNTLILNGASASNKVVVKVKLKGVYIGDESFIDGKIVLNQHVGMSGAISLTMTNRGSLTKQSLQIKPSVYIPEVYMDEAVGRANLSDDMEKEEISIGSLPDFLKSSETSLILTNPYIPIVIESSLLIDALYADITLIPRDENRNHIYDDNGNPIIIEIKDVSVSGDLDPQTGLAVCKDYVACQRIPELESLGYSFIECQELGMITKEIPAYIEVSGNGHTNPEDVLHFYMGESYNIDLDYEVRIPFMVEENTRIVYEEVTSDLNADIFNTITADEIFVNAKILNGFPANMSFEVEPYDVEGNKIDGIEILIPEEIKASETVVLTENVVPAETNLRLVIRELVKGDIKKIDQLKWRVNVVFPDKGLISKYQALNMRIALELPDGIVLDMDNL